MVNRKQRAAVAAETVEILNSGSYDIDGNRVTISQAVDECCRNTLLYPPDALEEFIHSLNTSDSTQTVLSVVNCTTFAAAQRLIAEGFENPLCLNFASAKNPGGGFLSGSQAQEESLARASGLYPSLLTQTSYYDVNRQCRTSLYTNHVIYSPRVPVFRDDQDHLLVSPYSVSIVTSPAVNAGAVRRNEPENIEKIESIMRFRIEAVLAIARKHNHRALVLGAWGCGVFANDPHSIASWYRDALTSQSPFANVFDRVVFAVLDYADEMPTFKAFQQQLAQCD
jgi:uncharacterized protein (TIGR02452 family)